MTQKLKRRNPPNKFQPRRKEQLPNRYNRPFWVPASNFYILSVAVSIVIFFVVWGILHEGGEQMPWILAGIAAGFALCAAVYLREVVLRKIRREYMLAERKLDYNLRNVPVKKRQPSNFKKMSLQRNAAILKEISAKSEAAKTLGKLSQGHLEVFEMCNEYLAINKVQLQTVGVGSPRLGALRRGKEIAEKLHKYHLLTWAELESRLLTKKANHQVVFSSKIETAQNALDVIFTARQYYPENEKLVESEQALREFVISIEISNWIEEAERAVFKEDYQRAISNYRDALFFLAREDIKNEEAKAIADKINKEIENVRKIEKTQKEKKLNSVRFEHLQDLND